MCGVRKTTSHNINKTKEMIVDFRKQTPIHIEGTAVEKMESFKFLSVHREQQGSLVVRALD